MGLAGHDTAYEVKDFVEKPSRAFARDLVAAGDWTWNSGMFVFPPRLFLDELERLRPDVLEAVTGALRTARVDLDFVRLDEREFTRSPTVSVDHAVMERTGRAAVVNADFGWNDVGSWSGLWQMGDRDQNGNVVLGDVLTDASSGCYLRADGVLLATLGLEDTIVVATSDVVLVANRTHDQQVREDRCRSSRPGTPGGVRPRGRLPGRGQLRSRSTRVPGCQVKRLTVKAGRTLSLQTPTQQAGALGGDQRGRHEFRGGGPRARRSDVHRRLGRLPAARRRRPGSSASWRCRPGPTSGRTTSSGSRTTTGGTSPAEPGQASSATRRISRKVAPRWSWVTST